MTALRRRLARRIAVEGPITVAEYMAQCLLHPVDGYYVRAGAEAGGDPFGAGGDFVTAPEVSQMFGELIGLWCVDSWRRLMGAPARFNLVELGPGRGTLMADALRAARVAPDFAAAAAINLVEAGPGLRAAQRARLGDAHAWHDGFDTVPDGPLLLIANEFFDALPIRQFVKGDRGFHERLVGLDPTGERLCFLQEATPSPLTPALTAIHPAANPGEIVEASPTADALAQAIARRIERHGGAALVIDYGSAVAEPGDSLQALHRHEKQHALAAPGAADLTAHVDFAAIARAVRDAGIACHGPVTQAAFLDRLGIRERADRLAAGADARQRGDIEAALARLLGAREMGTLFKALAMVPRNAPVPAGFASDEGPRPAR